jgi:4-amino-4-deoxy-L-arabinose transferase-like glycosyltransferase
VRRYEILALSLALAGAAASAFVSASIYERIPHLEDEIAFLWEASVMAEGAIALPSPEHAQSFPVPFVIDFEGLRFAKYPPGWPAALSLGVRVGAPWMVNALLSGVSLWLVFRLGSKLVSPSVGVLAALLTLISPMFIMLAGTLLSHMLSLFLTLSFTLSWIEITLHEGPKGSAPKWILVLTAGLSLGLLALTRPLTAVGVGLPFGMHGLWLLLRGKRIVRQQVGKQQVVPQHILLVGAIALILGALLPYWQAAQTGDPTRNLYTLWWEYDRVGFGAGIGLAEGGHTPLRGIGKTLADLSVAPLDLIGLSWIFLPFGIRPLREREGGSPVLFVIVGLILAYVLYWVGTRLFGPRYYFEALPSLAIASAVGVRAMGGWLSTKGFTPRNQIWGTSALLLALVLINGFIYLPPRLGKMTDLYDISRERMRPLENRGLEGGLLIVHPSYWTDYGTLLMLSPPFKEDGFQLAISLGAEIDIEIATQADGGVYHYYPDEPTRLYEDPR